MNEMKTASEWFWSMEPVIAHLAILNTSEKSLEKEYGFASAALASSFDWDSSYEGVDFWEDVYDALDRQEREGEREQEHAKAHTDDDGKPPLAKVPLALTEAVANVMEYGHKKYGDYNNYKKGMEISRNLSCALRHIMAFQNGEDLDPESGQNHLGHASARLGFVLDNLKRGTAIDDR